MITVIPTLITANPHIAKDKLVSLSGTFPWVQLDIIDGVFCGNKTLQIKDYLNIPHLSSFKTDIHLMVREPVNFIADCRKIGAKRIIGQIELMTDQKLFVQRVKQKKILVCLAVDLPTPLAKLNFNLLPDLDVVLLMSVKAGRGGQAFSKDVLTKTRNLAKIKEENKLTFKIAVDGGINPKTAKTAYKAGVEIFYVGSFLDKNPKEGLEKLKNG